jgi:Protein NO VEIN, C-terminal
MAESRSERRDWSLVEVEATVADYVDMLLMELRGQSFNKAERNRNLRALLDDRSRGAVELKHQNISAILIELGLPYVDGYKPRRNYQELLRDVVEDWVARMPDLIPAVQAEINRVPAVPSVDDILKVLVDAPVARGRVRQGRVRERPVTYRGHPNYLLLEARNSALGRAGEEFVLNFERARLSTEGKDRLAGRVEQVSVTRGDQEGFDVLSFTDDRTERWIEVKTTRFGAYTPFYVSRNELDVSRGRPDRYHLYRVFSFRERPQLFTMAGAVDRTCDLDPSQYVARVG